MKRVIQRSRTNPMYMENGAKFCKQYNVNETMVIDTDGFLKHYVGIGWINVRKATAEDKKKYPIVVEDQ